MSRESQWPRAVLAAVWLVASTCYATVPTLVLHSFVVTSYDQAITEQVVARLAHLSAPVTDVEGAGFNYFGDHFSPVLALYAPFYRLVPAPETMFAVQGAVLAASVVVVLVAATRLVGRRCAALVAALYALSSGLVDSVVMSARGTPFAVLLLAVAGACFLRRDTRGVVLAGLGLLLVKEDLGLTVAAIGAVLALESRSRRAGLALAAAGLACVALVMLVVIPSLASDGPSHQARISTITLDAATSGWGLKLVTLALTVGTVGLLCLRHRWCLVAVPTLAWRFASTTVSYWTPLWHYSAPLMPVVFVAALPVLARSRPWQRRLALGVSATTTALMLAWLVALPGALVASALTSDRPDEARRALASVPVGASVVTDDHLVSHLAGDRTTYHLTTFAGCPRADWVVAHVGEPESHVWGGVLASPWTFDSAAALLAFADEAYGGTHEVVLDEGGYAVLHRLDDGDDTGACVPHLPDPPGTD